MSVSQNTKKIPRQELNVDITVLQAHANTVDALNSYNSGSMVDHTFLSLALALLPTLYHSTWGVSMYFQISA